MEGKLDLILSELQTLNKGQKALEERLTSLEKGQAALEERLTTVEDRLTTVEDRLTTVENGLTTVEKNQISLEERQSALENGQRELHQMVSAIRGNQLEARAGFDSMQHDIAHIKGDIVEIKEILPTLVTQDKQKRTEERLDVHTFQIARVQERLAILEQREKQQ